MEKIYNYIFFALLGLPIIFYSDLSSPISGDGSHFAISYLSFSEILKKGHTFIDGGTNLEISIYFPMFFIADIYSFLFFFNEKFVQFFTYFTLRYIIPFFSIYLFLGSFFNLKKKIIFFPAIFFYIYNPFLNQVGFEYNFFSIYVFAPLTLGLYQILNKKLLEEKSRYEIYLLVFLINISLFLSQSGIMILQYSVVYFIFGFGLFFFHLLKFKKKNKITLFIRYHFYIILLIILFNFYWIYDAIINFAVIIDDEFFIRLAGFVNSKVPAFDGLRLLGAWYLRASDSLGLYNSYMFFYDSIIGNIISLIFLTLIIYSVFFIKSDYKKLFIIIFIIVSILICGSGGSVPLISSLFYNFKIMLIFREPSKFSLILILLYCLLITSFINEFDKSKLKSKNSYIFLLIFTIFYLCLPTVTFHKDQKNPYRNPFGNISEEYFKLKEYFVQNKPKGVVLSLPQTNYGFRLIGEKSFPINVYPEKILLDSVGVKTLSINYNEKFINSYDLLNNFKILSPDYLSFFNIEYLIIHKDYDYIYEEIVNRKSYHNNFNNIIKIIDKNYFSLVKTFKIPQDNYILKNKYKNFFEQNNIKIEDISNEILIFKNINYKPKNVFSYEKIVISDRKKSFDTNLSKVYLLSNDLEKNNYDFKNFNNLKKIEKKDIIQNFEDNTYDLEIKLKKNINHLLIFPHDYYKPTTKIISDKINKLKTIRCNFYYTCLFIDNSEDFENSVKAKLIFNYREDILNYQRITISIILGFMILIIINYIYRNVKK